MGKERRKGHHYSRIMSEEIDSLIKNKTWEEVDRPAVNLSVLPGYCSSGEWPCANTADLIAPEGVFIPSLRKIGDL